MLIHRNLKIHNNFLLLVGVNKKGNKFYKVSCQAELLEGSWNTVSEPLKQRRDNARTLWLQLRLRRHDILKGAKLQ